jgi:hypothetical protein
VYCGQCGTPNNEESGHCETCGAPLLISTGARTCGQCGASLGDNDRFCTSCGASATDGGATDVYDASDDFGELNIDDIQLDDLPDWLQSMAPSPETDRQPAQAMDHNQPTPDDLPDWLRDTPASSATSGQSASPAASNPPPGQQSSVDHQPANEFSLVSDDDLPDWLKALSDDDGDSGEFATSSASTSSQNHSDTRQTWSTPEPDRSRAVANPHDVPVISRAWLTQGRQVDQTQVTAARQEFLPLDAVADISPAQARSRSIWDAEPEDAQDDEETTPFVLSPEGDDTQSQTGTGRGKLIARIVILVLLVIVALLLAFVLIQGV